MTEYERINEGIDGIDTYRRIWEEDGKNCVEYDFMESEEEEIREAFKEQFPVTAQYLDALESYFKEVILEKQEEQTNDKN